MEGISGIKDIIYRTRFLQKNIARENVLTSTKFSLLLWSITLFYSRLAWYGCFIWFELELDLEETIYMDQPEGFIVKGKKDHVCRLSHYMAWNSLQDSDTTNSIVSWLNIVYSKVNLTVVCITNYSLIALQFINYSM